MEFFEFSSDSFLEFISECPNCKSIASIYDTASNFVLGSASAISSSESLFSHDRSLYWLAASPMGTSLHIDESLALCGCL